MLHAFRTLTIALGIWSFSFPLLAQQDSLCNYQIQGKVLELNTDTPIAFANVQLAGTHLGTVTDDEGFFNFEGLCKKEYDILFSFVGYKTLKHHHDFHHPYLEIFLAPEQYQLESIVVEGEAVNSDFSSLSSVKLSREALQAVASESFADVAGQITGVNILSTGQNVDKPIIHGLHSNRILIMNNGIRHEFQNWGAEHAPEIDPSLIDNLEVVKGAGTVRFGPDALGGVILINPPKMELATPLKGKFGVTGKSNGQSGEFTGELRKGFKNVSLMGGGSYVKQGDLEAPNYMLTNTGKAEASYYGSFRLHLLPELDIEGYYSHFGQNLGILSGSVFGNLEDIQRALTADIPLYTEPFSYSIGEPRQETQHDVYKLSAKYIGQRQSFLLQYGYQINQRQEYGVRRIPAPNIDLKLQTQTIDFEWLLPTVGDFSTKFGGQWLSKANENLPGTNTVPFIPNYDEERIGLYLIEALDIAGSTFELGLRFDYFDSFIIGREPNNDIYRNNINYQNFSGTLGWKRQVNKYSQFQTNFGTAWRPPDVAELYRFGQHAFFLEYGLWRYTIDENNDAISTSDGIQTAADRPVPSEVGYKWINTYSIEKSNFRAEATGYINYIENYIYSKPAGITRLPKGFFVYYLYDQTDALLWGIDASMEWEHAKTLTSGFRGSYLWSKQIRNDDFFVGQPPLKLAYDLSYRPKWKGLKETQLKLGLQYTFEQTQYPRILSIDEFINAGQNGIPLFGNDAKDFDILPPPAGFFLADFTWMGSIQRITWQFQVKNLFNTAYRNYTDRLRYFSDDMGRNLVLSLHYQF